MIAEVPYHNNRGTKTTCLLRTNFGILPCMVLFVMVGLERSVAQDNRIYSATEPLGEYIRSVSRSESGVHDRQAMAGFLLRFEDFGCLACFENLLELCDSVASHVPPHGFAPAILIFPSSDDQAEQQRLLEAWRIANNIRLKVIIVPSWRYDAYSIRYSTVALLDSGATVSFMGQLPLSLGDRNRILAKLFPRRRK